MKSNIVYLKLEQCSEVVNRKILLQDVGEIFCADTSLQKEIGELALHTVKGDKEEKIIFSSMKVIEMIQKQRPELLVENIGETDFVVDYKIPGKSKKALEYLKTALLMLIVFIGSAFTIMTFNTDVSVGDVFSLFYKMVMGTEQTKGSILEIMYCIGLAVGILGFYNHFSRKKEDEDPTPIHIEMQTYEEDMNKAIIKTASREQKIIK